MSEELPVIKTIEDLQWYQGNNPDAVEWALEQVTVLEDLKKYLAWLSAAEQKTTLVSSLRRNKARSLGIHPSSACKKKVCLLKLYHECKGDVEPKRKYERGMQLTWDIGTMLHDLHQLYFLDMYNQDEAIVFRKEVYLEIPRLYVKSSTDGLFDFTYIRFILEMKSIKEGGNFGWDTVQNKPMVDNIRQSHYYMKGANVPFALIFYIGKNNSEYKEHAVVFDQDIWNELEHEVVQPVIKAAYEDGPMIEANPQWDCRWCDFEYQCGPAKEAKRRDKSTRRAW